MTPARALSFVKKHGVVLVSAKGPVPTLSEAIAGEPIKGSWWGHPKGKKIFWVLDAVTDSRDVLVCRLVGGKLTLVHKRLWPALIRASARFPRKNLARVIQEHTPSGRHVNREVAFPKWAPSAAAAKARELSEEEALRALRWEKAD